MFLLQLWCVCGWVGGILDDMCYSVMYGFVIVLQVYLRYIQVCVIFVGYICDLFFQYVYVFYEYFIWVY